MGVSNNSLLIGQNLFPSAQLKYRTLKSHFPTRILTDPAFSSTIVRYTHTLLANWKLWYKVITNRWVGGGIWHKMIRGKKIIPRASIQEDKFIVLTKGGRGSRNKKNQWVIFLNLSGNFYNGSGWLICNSRTSDFCNIASLVVAYVVVCIYRVSGLRVQAYGCVHSKPVD